MSMSPSAVTTINCYIYRNGFKYWTAETADLPDIKCSCETPESVLRRCQSMVLDKLAEQVMRSDSQLSSNIQININVSVTTEEEAKRILGTRDIFEDGTF